MDPNVTTRSWPASNMSSSHDERAQRWSALLSVAEAAMPRFLLRRRWYPAKNLTAPPQVTAVASTPFVAPGSDAAITTWEVKSPQREAIRMFVPLALVPAADADPRHLLCRVPKELAGDTDTALIDAFSLDAFVQAWVSLHLGRRDSVPPELLRVGKTEQLTSDTLDASGAWSIKQGTAEQSNTSIRVGERTILKVFRKLEEGLHPELELGRYLTQTGFTAIPALLGWIEIEENDDLGWCTASVLQSFVPNEGDGWSWTLERLKRTTLNQEEPPRADMLDWLRSLAQRTAEMHRTFARNSQSAEFHPERVAASDLAAWANSARESAAHVFHALEATTEQAKPQLLWLASELRSRRTLLERSIQRLTELPSTFTKSRLHGDFHLGQTLVVGRDAIIIDFEGEPLRPIAERRAKHCVLRDVAGMLRSFSYAAATAERTLPKDFTAEQREGARAKLAAWQARASTAFLDTYIATSQGISSLPADRPQAERLLRFFLLEKALYEITYEMANRPDWVDIPLRGVLELLDLEAEEA